MGKKPFLERVREALKKTTVEPFTFFVFFGIMVRLVTIQHLFTDRSCRLLLEYPNEVCDKLDEGNNDYQQSRAITYGNNLYVGYIMISTVPALVMATFLGPWSDKYSRKYPLVIAMTGMLIDSSISAVLSGSPNISPIWFLASAAFSGLTGGAVVALSATYSYMSDVTDAKSRPTRYAILEFFNLIATPLGSLIGGQIFNVGGYTAVMCITPCSFGMALLWAIFYIKETKPKIFGITKREIFRDLFRLDNVKASYKTCAQPRPGNLRLQIWLLIYISCTNRVINIGSVSIGFPYAKTMFKWDVTRYSNAFTVFNLLTAFATPVIVPILNKKLFLHDAAVGLVGVLSSMAKMVLFSVAFHPGFLYYAWFAGIFYASAGIAVRSRISKLVNKQELGRVFSLLATCESVTPVLGALAFTQVYNSSVFIYPGLPYAAAAAGLIPAAAIFCWMMGMPTISLADLQASEDTKKMKELEDVTSTSFTE